MTDTVDNKPWAYAIGDELRRLRKVAEMTQEAVGQRMGMSRPLVARMEKGLHTTGMWNFVRFCRAVGADPGAALNRIAATYYRPRECPGCDTHVPVGMQCGRCGGSGVVEDSMMSKPGVTRTSCYQPKKKTCPRCDGLGRSSSGKICSSCGGTGLPRSRKI